MREIIVVTPVYNDWESLFMLVQSLTMVADKLVLCIRLLTVDDGSTIPPYVDFPSNLQIGRLARHLGHQRAIAVGLAFTHARLADLQIVVMDCVGEDSPEDIPALLAEYDRHPGYIIFARRAKRYERVIFHLFYAFFKLIFHILTGNSINFGNFSIISNVSQNRTFYLLEFWNHFAAGVIHSELLWRTVPTERGIRYASRSHMNLVTPILLGLSAISVYIEVVYVRLLIAALFLMGLDVISLIILVFIRFITSLAISGWATTTAIGLALVMVQTLLFLVLLSFVVLSYRSTKMFNPALDYKDFFNEFERWPE